MGLYSSAVQVSIGSTLAGPACDLESSAIEYPAIVEIDFSVTPAAGTAGLIGIGRASNTPVALFRQPFIAEEPNDPDCTSCVATAWSTAPTVPANYFRRIAFVGNVAEYVLFTFKRGVRLAPSSSLVAWEISNAPMQAQVGWEIKL